jgi:hypothetical protein
MTKDMFAGHIALPVLSAGIVGGAALGLAGMANAATPTVASGPGYSYAPSVEAKPAPESKPGRRNHKGIRHINALNGN